MDFFSSTFLDMFHLSISGASGMVFKHFWNSFNPDDSTSGFI
jgi:hypothetical protein